MVPTPTVIVELRQQAAPEEIRALEGSCESALGQGKCAVGAMGGTSLGEYRAVLRSSDEGREVTVLLHTVGPDARRVGTRVLTFANTDPPRQRWQASGLVVAALVRDHQALRVRQRTQPAPLRPVTGSGGPSPGPGPENGGVPTLHLITQVELLAGPGFSPGPMLLGGEVGVALALTTQPWFPRLGFSYSEGSSHYRVSSIAGSAGVGFRLFDWESVAGAELHLDGQLERVAFNAVRDGQEASANRLRWGGRLQAVGTWRVTPALHLMVGLTGVARTPAVEVVIAASPAGASEALGWETATGLRFIF